jgi:hypothetical protein
VVGQGSLLSIHISKALKKDVEAIKHKILQILKDVNLKFSLKFA